MNTFDKALEFLSKHPETINLLFDMLDCDISMPNIPMPTMGGKVFWITLCERNGWKLQQNTITHHARILNSQNIRVAWGTINGMKKALEHYIELSNIK